MIYDKYPYIQKVAELQNISKAAKELYISQPALTRIITNLETELGVCLFNRSVLPIKLTYAGERYLAEAKRVHEIDMALKQEMQEIAVMKRGTLLVGADYCASSLWLPHILPAFSEQYPGITTKICQQTSPMFEEDLLKNKIDLAFTTRSIVSGDLSYEPLSSARILLYIPNRHPLLQDCDISGNSLNHPVHISADALQNQDFVLLHPSFGLGKTVDNILNMFDIRPRQIMYTTNIVACYRLAASGLGITFATPYATRYTFPGSVPVIGQLVGEDVAEHNIIAYNKYHNLSTPEKAFIQLSKEKISNHPMLQPLSEEQWLRLKDGTLSEEDSYWFV